MDKAEYSYVGNDVGTDTIKADVTVDNFLFNSNFATATWTNNSVPVCSSATPSTNLIIPPDNSYVPITINGLTDPDGGPLVGFSS